MSGANEPMEGGFAISIEAASAAAHLFISNLMVKLSSANYTLSQIRRAIAPFHSIHWNRKVIAAVGGDRILRMFSRLWLSKLPKGSSLNSRKSPVYNATTAPLSPHFVWMSGGP